MNDPVETFRETATAPPSAVASLEADNGSPVPQRQRPIVMFPLRLCIIVLMMWCRIPLAHLPKLGRIAWPRLRRSLEWRPCRRTAAACWNLVRRAAETSFRWAFPGPKANLSASTCPNGRFLTDSRLSGELEVRNVDLRCQSILDVERELGKFDYILCHGVYSRVPPEVQDKILEICRSHLHPHGVAYVSYNTFPGWHARAAIREMLCYHTERFEDPSDRIREARGLLTFLVRSVESHDAAFDSMIRQEIAVLSATPDTYLLHEHLEEFNEPLYFHQFIDRAAAKNLQYLGEAQVTAMFAGRLGPEVEATLRRISPDLVQMEQYMDFLRNRMFRQTLLCHDNVKLDYVLRPEAVQKMWIASQAKPVSEKPDLLIGRARAVCRR